MCSFPYLFQELNTTHSNTLQIQKMMVSLTHKCFVIVIQLFAMLCFVFFYIIFVFNTHLAKGLLTSTHTHTQREGVAQCERERYRGKVDIEMMMFFFLLAELL